MLIETPRTEGSETAEHLRIEQQIICKYLRTLYVFESQKKLTLDSKLRFWGEKKKAKQDYNDVEATNDLS